MKEEWLLPGAVVPVTPETVVALINEIKRMIGVVGDMALKVADEREACAQVADSMDPLQDGAIGAAIRVRGHDSSQEGAA